MNAGTLEIQLLANVARLQADMTQAHSVVRSTMQGIEAAAATAVRALGAIGVGLSIAGILALTKSSIDAMARMKDLGQEAGTTAAAISKFDAPARMAGLSLDSVAAAMFKMSKAALEAKDPASKASQALNAIGISTAQLKGLKPDEMFELVARSLGKYGDGLEKNAVMQELFGKSGREMNRVVAEIAETGKLAATVTNEQAEAADRLQDQIVQLKMNSEEFWRGLISDGVPALNAITKAFIDGLKEGNLYQAMIAATSEAFEKMFRKTPQHELAALNEEIARVVKSQERIADRGTAMNFLFTSKEEVAYAKSLNDLLQRRAGIEKQIWDAEFAAQNKRAIAGQTPGKPTPGFDPAAQAKDAAEARRLEALAIKEAKDQLALYIKGVEAATAAEQERKEQMAAFLGIQDAAIKSMWKSIEQIEFETTLLGKSNNEREIAIALRTLETSGIDKQSAAYDFLADKLRASITEQQRVRTEIEASTAAQRNSASAWEDLADRVIHGFGNMREALRQFGKDLLAMFAKKYFLQMVAGVTGNTALGAVAGSMGEGTAGSIGSSLIGTLGSSALGAMGISGIGGAGVGASMWGAMGAGTVATETGVVLATGSMAGTAVGTGAMAGVYSALAAIPVWGWIAMAVIAIGAYIAGGHKGGPKGGGSFIGEFDAGGTMGRSQFGERLYTPSGADPLMRQLVEGTSAGYMQALRLMGGTSAGMTFGLGMDTDPEGTAPNRITSMVRDAMGATIFSTLNRDIGRDEENIGPQMQLETQRMILAALQASELPAAVAEVLNGLVASTASGEEITAAIQAAQTVYSIIQALGKIGMVGLDINTLKAMQLQGESLTDTFNALVAAQANYYDLFFSEEEKKQRLQDELLAQFQLMGLVMPATRDGFRALIEGLDLSTTGGARLYRALLELAPAFAQLVPAAEAITAAVVAGGPAMWSGYTPDEQAFRDWYSPEAVAARKAALDLAKAFDDARQSLRDWIDNLLLNEQLSPLTPMQRLEEARAQYQKTLGLAQGGDLGAMGQLTGSSETYLRIAREIFASSSAYNDIFRDVVAGVGGVAGMTPADVNARLAAALPQNSQLASRADLQEVNTSILQLITVISNGLSVNDPENKVLLEELNTNLRSVSNKGVLA